MPEGEPQPKPPEPVEIEPAETKRFTTAIDTLLAQIDERPSGRRSMKFQPEGSKDEIRVVRRPAREGDDIYIAQRTEPVIPVANEKHQIVRTFAIGADGKLRYEFRDEATDADTKETIYHPDRHPDALNHEELLDSQFEEDDATFEAIADRLEESPSIDPKEFGDLLSLLEVKAGLVIEIPDE